MAPEYDPGLAAHLRDYPEGSEGAPVAPTTRVSVSTLLSDPAFKGLPATDQQIIFDHVKSQDAEFQALPDRDQQIIAGHALGGLAPPLSPREAVSSFNLESLGSFNRQQPTVASETLQHGPLSTALGILPELVYNLTLQPF